MLLRLGGLAHLNVTVAEDVRGNVNLSLHDATPDEAVHAVCSQLQLRCVREGRSLAVYGQSSVVVPLAIVRAGRAAQMVRQLYPRLAVRVDPAANALILAGAQNDIQSARAVIAGLDVRDATKPTTEAITLRTQSAQTVADRLRSLYPAAKISVLSRTTMLISATPPDLAQIKTLVAGIDAPTPPPVSVPVSSDAVKVSQRRPQDVARAITAQIPHVRAAVSGTSITLTGSPDDVNRAKALIAQLDLPPYGARYTQIYRVRNVDAKSVGALIQRSFPSATVTVDADLNSLSVTATAAEQQRISDGIAQIDGTAAAPNGQNPAGRRRRRAVVARGDPAQVDHPRRARRRRRLDDAARHRRRRSAGAARLVSRPARDRAQRLAAADPHRQPAEHSRRARAHRRARRGAAVGRARHRDPRARREQLEEPGLAARQLGAVDVHRATAAPRCQQQPDAFDRHPAVRPFADQRSPRR